MPWFFETFFFFVVFRRKANSLCPKTLSCFVAISSFARWMTQISRPRGRFSCDLVEVFWRQFTVNSALNYIVQFRGPFAYRLHFWLGTMGLMFKDAQTNCNVSSIVKCKLLITGSESIFTFI
ncbi:hypothetical protein BRADI_1g06495v3 [Brachypodium distachyon]|uniref:Secreted protein n=1 Tax=Brachypodium distachyon TaxID=15368 RepID=A0A0Q3N874_BRADI|nr:hypothetical protein BRADI_1g06495v3 [Brachypodium distachyon]PNT74008.1 hypothetical protein BRADI_1g06495v3 [Brachypodium distachyon]PNT74009.1 hypothetical protein BRADI_1g06495v3 [Brachypodium distachyon]